MKTKRNIVIIGALAAMVALVVLARFISEREYDYLVYQGEYYYISNQIVDEEECGECVGEILNQVPIRILGGNADYDSNKLPVGAKIYIARDERNNPPVRVLVSYEGKIYVANIVSYSGGSRIVYADQKDIT